MVSQFGKVWLPLDASLRRSYVGKGHGGQKRAFKVKFLGEGVNDYGGPYRAVFEQVVDELQAELDDSGECLLPFLKPSPNRCELPGVVPVVRDGVGCCPCM